jgi:pSer/pThr/pTyr-binding forkhead associated (FHA) protein
MSSRATVTTEGATAERVVRKPPFGAPYVFVLVVIEGKDTTAVHRIVETETTIGRGAKASLRIEDETVSKRHCTIRVEGPVCTLVDLGSRNGTRVNGRPLQGVASRLRHLDEIQVGNTRLMLLGGRFKPRAPEAKTV